VSPQKYLLRRLLGLGSAAEHPERDAEHAVLVGDHQLLEGSGVAPPEPIHQLSLIAGPLH